MSLIFNKKIRIIIFSTTLLLLSCIIMILAMIHTFHNEEEFENTTIVKDIVTEQTDMIYEFCIKNNIRGIKYRSFEEIFGNPL